MKSREEHIAYFNTEKGKVIHKAILDGKEKRKSISFWYQADAMDIKNKMDSEIEVEEGYSIGLFQNIIEAGLLSKTGDDITVVKVQAIYDKHKVLLNNMKENRAKEQDKTPDAELRLMDEMITSLAGVLGELYREILHKE
jgi:5-enolpyruvylshikimate-3-phosphate synthase